MEQNNNDQAAKGCELCGDFPAQLQSRCHPTAPLRVEALSEHEIALYCYLPKCNRLVARFLLAGALH
jgi:hypothetical protein